MAISIETVAVDLIGHMASKRIAKNVYKLEDGSIFIYDSFDNQAFVVTTYHVQKVLSETEKQEIEDYDIEKEMAAVLGK